MESQAAQRHRQIWFTSRDSPYQKRAAQIPQPHTFARPNMVAGRSLRAEAIAAPQRMLCCHPVLVTPTPRRCSGDGFDSHQTLSTSMIAIHHPPPESAGDPADLQPGQLVRHRRYGYRGVIVERDAHCQADEAWYLSNQTQPARDQIWYHVLVHESNACTYAAAENLVSDTSQLPIVHPLLTRFFSAWQAGRYLRNNQPWPR
ncbi:MAG: heat shock protein HspQ [Planctomycetota bacterium]|nr:heat shock protein HspQ [Planctomycetota bacterium]